MAKLWAKGYQFDTLIEAFTVGDDPVLDQGLAQYDCLGSMAHAAMLYKIGILTQEEWQFLHVGLCAIVEKVAEGTFFIEMEQEDVHTAVENALGHAGKKLHTARSRNDQVLVDIRLYTKDKLHAVLDQLLSLITALVAFAEKYSDVAVPGRTHMQRAMPSSLGLWAAAIAEALLDSIELIKGAYALNDQCPLGSAASYGCALPIDRAYVSDLLGFSAVQNNVLYANNSRGKIEAAVVHSLCQMMNDLSKMASDVMFFSLPEVGYMTLAAEVCSGSSLMPQKVNPDPLELVRAKAATVASALSQLLEVSRPLPSGYHRDYQETKRPLMHTLDIGLGAVAVMQRVLESITVDADACLGAFSAELFATDRALELSAEGVPFREAYGKVARELDQVAIPDPVSNILSKTHVGAPGNLGLEFLAEKIAAHAHWINAHKQSWQEAMEGLIQLAEGGSNG